MLNGKFIFKNGRFMSERGRKSSKYYSSINDFNNIHESQIAPVASCKLIVDFHQWENAVTAKIIHQDESLRGNDEIASNGEYAIFSKNTPELSIRVLYVRGREKDYDNIVSSYSFKTISEADEWLTNIKELINEINSPVSSHDIKIKEIQDKMEALSKELEELKTK